MHDGTVAVQVVQVCRRMQYVGEVAGLDGIGFELVVKWMHHLDDSEVRSIRKPTHRGEAVSVPRAHLA